MAETSSSAVEIKGYGNDVTIIIDSDASFPAVEAQLIKRLENSYKFFSGVPIVLDVGDRTLAFEECEVLREILGDRFGLSISSVRSTSDETSKVIGKIGWEVKSRQQMQKQQTKRNEKVNVSSVTVEEGNDSALFKGTLRSGQRKWHRGNIIIVGDVNPGAEVVATGDIIVFGKLRGVAHAGAEGDASAEIIALDLRPIQLRISGYIGRAPDLDLKTNGVPERARVEDGNIVVSKLV